jgi:hypothetical protein
MVTGMLSGTSANDGGAAAAAPATAAAAATACWGMGGGAWLRSRRGEGELSCFLHPLLRANWPNPSGFRIFRLRCRAQEAVATGTEMVQEFIGKEGALIWECHVTPRMVPFHGNAQGSRCRR